MSINCYVGMQESTKLTSLKTFPLMISEFLRIENSYKIGREHYFF